MSSRRLGRYQLHERLGAGPIGEVYRATIYGVAGSAVVFAVKRIHDRIVGSPELMAALARGARVYGSVDHQYVARFRELGTADHEHYIATDWIYGMDAARLIAANRLAHTTVPIPIALTIVALAARSIAGVHASGLMHLGVAPRNVLLTPAGDVVTTDVGMFAALLSERTPRELALGERGAYLAPEQWRGTTCTLATDVWALAALAIELVSGQPAAGPNSEAAEANIVAGNLVRAVVPAPIASVLNRATAIDPSHRFSSAILFAEALEAAMRSCMAMPSPNELAEIVRQAQVAEAGVRSEEQSGLLTIKSLAQGHAAPRIGLQGGNAGPSTTPTITGHALARTLRPGDIPPPPMIGAATSSPGMVALRPMPTLESLASVPPQGPHVPPTQRMPSTSDHTTPIDETDLITVRADSNDANLFDITHQGAPRTARESVPPPPPSLTSMRAIEPVPRDQPSNGPSTIVAEATEPNEQDAATTASGRSRAALPPIPQMSRPAIGPGTSGINLPSSVPASATTLASAPAFADTPSNVPTNVLPLAELEFDLPQPTNGGSQPLQAPRAGTSEPIPYRAPTSQSSPPYQHPAVTLPPVLSASSSSHLPMATTAAARRTASRLVIVTVTMACIALAGLGVLAWQTYNKAKLAAEAPVNTPAPAMRTQAAATPTADAATTPPTPPRDATTATAPQDAATAVAPDASAVAVNAKPPLDAAAPTPDASAIATVPTPTTPTPPVPPTPPVTPTLPVTSNAMPSHVSASVKVTSDPAPAGQFIIESTPPALVFIDGTNKGKTPVTLPAANDTFTVSLFAEGYALYTGTLGGTSRHKIVLEKAERFAGSAGIKVRCNEKKRYYVLVDGRQTGQLCPTERLGMRMGVHKIEIVDLIGEVYRELSADANNEDKSIRVQID